MNISELATQHLATTDEIEAYCFAANFDEPLTQNACIARDYGFGHQQVLKAVVHMTLGFQDESIISHRLREILRGDRTNED